MAGKYVASPVAIEQGQYVAYAALTTMAIVPIYFGSRASLKKWKVNEHLSNQLHLSRIWKICYNISIGKVGLLAVLFFQEPPY